MEKQKKNEKRIIKSGFSPNGKQMYKDKITGRRFIADEDRTPMGYSKEQREQSLSLYLEGVGLRSIGRFIGCSHASIINWIKAAAKRLDPLSETLLDESKSGVVEMDEMWHYFKKK